MRPVVLFVSLVTKIMNSKIQDQTEKFHQRFPRDHRYVSKKSLDNLPKKSHSMTTAGRRGDQTQLSNLEDQVMEIFESVDENEDKATDAWEMHDWIVYVEGLVHKSILDDQWHNYGLDDKANITWADFASQVIMFFLNLPKYLYTIHSTTMF